MDAKELCIRLLDRDLPVKINCSNGWTAEYVTHLVAGKYLGIKAIALEVNIFFKLSYFVKVTYNGFNLISS